MNPKSFNIVRIVAVFFTLTLIVGERYLPEKQFQAIPGDKLLFELFSDIDYGGKSTVEWINEKNNEWRCHVIRSDVYAGCGASMVFSYRPYEVFDLSKYSAVEISLSYQGPADKIRIYIRNHDPRYSTLFNIEATKFQSVTLRVADITPQASILLSEFSVADWWKDQFNIPRKLSHPDFSQVVSIGVDLASPISYGDHTYSVKSLKFTGDWVKPVQLYLAIILGWMGVIAWEAGTRLLYLYRRTKRDSKKLLELRAESLKYKELSKTDALTGIINRVGLVEMLSPLVKQEAGFEGYAVMVVDIDHFKRINDMRGHDVGDRILKAFARRVSESIRSDDIFARWGGEEFVIVTHNDDREAVRAFAEKIRSAVHVYVFEPDKPLKLSVSLGVAFTQSNELFEDCFKRADECLYRAKNLGRNCVVIEDE
ncbi:diguanylate cyclase (GGDEF)-like protein [Alteromonadaceae bacterium 2753L.S.0a.02]|nr:diguanylate cyclase (GGDEF)-like protein [Alteromonadaceae bacterium 2753L.S.0a.02]